VSPLAVCLIHCSFTSSEHFEILLPPIHILNSFSRPCSNVLYYIRMKAFTYIYTYIGIQKANTVSGEKSQSHACVFFLSSHVDF